MPKQKKKTAVKILILVPYLLVLYIFQAMIFSRLPIMGTKPLILPLAVVGAALFGGSISGGIFGIFAGILCDLSFNQPTIQFTIILTLLGIFLGILADTVLVRGFPSYLASSAIALVICSICQIFPLLFFSGMAFVPLLNTAVIQSLYSLIFAIPLYYCARFINRII